MLGVQGTLPKKDRQGQRVEGDVERKGWEWMQPSALAGDHLSGDGEL